MPFPRRALQTTTLLLAAAGRVDGQGLAATLQMPPGSGMGGGMSPGGMAGQQQPLGGGGLGVGRGPTLAPSGQEIGGNAMRGLSGGLPGMMGGGQAQDEAGRAANEIMASPLLDGKVDGAGWIEEIQFY